MKSCDIAIIGGGPAGYTGAIRAAQLGKRVVLIERGGLGGVCLNRGCIPTKTYVASASVLRACRRAEEFGIDLAGPARVNFSRVQDRKRSILSSLRKGIERLLGAARVDVVRGAASFSDAHTLRIGRETLAADRIIIATGSEWIRVPSLVPDGDRICNSDHAMAWQALPSSVLIVGGGYIGCEFASFMNQMGVEVTIVEATDGLLPVVDRAVAKILQRQFAKNGITLLTGTRVEATEREAHSVVTTLTDGTRIRTDKLLVSVGRKPATESLNLPAAGVECGGRGEISVDEHFETSAPGIFAVGDVNGQVMLAHAASEQAIACVERLCGGDHPYDGRYVPSCIFTEPEIGYVGLTAEQLSANAAAFTTGRFPFAALGKAQVDGSTQGQVIVHADPDGKILGVHAIGDGAVGIVAEATVALKQGMTVQELSTVIHAHPTVSEALAEAARDVQGWAIQVVRRRRT